MPQTVVNLPVKRSQQRKSAGRKSPPAKKAGRAAAISVKETALDAAVVPTEPASTGLISLNSTSLRRVEAMSPGQDFSAYLNVIQSIEILSAEEEQRLARRFRLQGDMEAARLLVLSHLRFVAHIARSYLGYGMPHADLTQEGNVGLMKAVQHYDPEVGVRLISFAVHWIKSEIHEYILQNWSVVKIATTKEQRKLFFNLRKKKKSLGWLSDEEAQIIAKDLNVPVAQVRQMEMRLSGSDIPLTLPGEEQDMGGSTLPALQEPVAEGADPALLLEADQYREYNHQQLGHALSRLDERSRDIVNRRWLQEGKTGLKELAEEYGISSERVRQIEAKAIAYLRKSLADGAAGGESA